MEKMSNIASIILAFSPYEEKEKRLNEVDFYFKGNGFYKECDGFRAKFDVVKNHGLTDGTKLFCSNIAFSAINNFDSNEFLKHLANKVNWFEPDKIQIIYSEEGWEGWFEIINLRDWKKENDWSDLKSDFPSSSSSCRCECEMCKSGQHENCLKEQIGKTRESD